MRADRGGGSRANWRLTALAAVAAWTVACALSPSGALADSVALTWTAPGDDGNVGRASSYEMRYSENPVAAADTASWWASATSVGTMPAPLTSGSHESFVVAGLASGKTFYFAIRASDERPNVSGFSNIAVKQTSGGSITLATPANFRAAVGQGAVLLTWSAIPSGGPELGYRLYRKVTTDPAASLLATLPLGAVSYNDSTAAVGESYDFSLATYDNSTEGTRTTLTVAMPGSVSTQNLLLHGYPNPARDQVTFKLAVDAVDSGHRTTVTIYDLTGHRICVLADGVFSPGEHLLAWPCRTDQGARVAPGLYNVIVDGPLGRATTRIAIVP